MLRFRICSGDVHSMHGTSSRWPAMVAPARLIPAAHQQGRASYRGMWACTRGKHGRPLIGRPWTSPRPGFPCRVASPEAPDRQQRHGDTSPAGQPEQFEQDTHQASLSWQQKRSRVPRLPRSPRGLGFARHKTTVEHTDQDGVAGSRVTGSEESGVVGGALQRDGRRGHSSGTVGGGAVGPVRGRAERDSRGVADFAAGHPGRLWGVQDGRPAVGGVDQVGLSSEASPAHAQEGAGMVDGVHRVGEVVHNANESRGRGEQGTEDGDFIGTPQASLLSEVSGQQSSSGRSHGASWPTASQRGVQHVQYNTRAEGPQGEGGHGGTSSALDHRVDCKRAMQEPVQTGMHSHHHTHRASSSPTSPARTPRPFQPVDAPPSSVTSPTPTSTPTSAMTAGARSKLAGVATPSPSLLSPSLLPRPVLPSSSAASPGAPHLPHQQGGPGSAAPGSAAEPDLPSAFESASAAYKEKQLLGNTARLTSLAKQLDAQVHLLQPDQISSILQSCAAIHYKLDRHLLSAMAVEVQHDVPHTPPHTLISILTSLTRCGFTPDRQFLRASLDQCLDSLHDVPPAAAVQLLWVLASLRYPSATAVVQQLLTRIGGVVQGAPHRELSEGGDELTPGQLSDAMWAASQYGYTLDHPLLLPLLSALLRHAEHLSAHDITSALHALANQKQSQDAHRVRRLHGHAASPSAPHAGGERQAIKETVLHQLVQRLHPYVRQLSAQEASDVLLSCAVLGCCADEVVEELMMELHRGMTRLSLKDITKVVRALRKMRRQPSEAFLRSMQQQVKEQWKTCDPRQADTLMRGLRTLQSKRFQA